MFRGFNLMPVFLVALLAFVMVGAVQFVSSWPAAARGLLIFEKACPIYTTSQSKS